MKLSEKIHKLRVDKGLTIKELAKKSGVSSVSISNYENGHCKPLSINTAKLAKALDCSYDYLAKED